MSGQDFAEVRGWGYVSGLTPESAQKLVELIPTLGSDTMTWGRQNGGEPLIEPDGRVRVAMAYGPVLGAWPADLRKKLQAATDSVQLGASVEIVNTARDVHATRAEYDRGKREPSPSPDPVPDEHPAPEGDYREMTPVEKAQWHEERDGDEAKARKTRERAERHARWPESDKARGPFAA